jgi:glutaredoxin-like protein
LKQKKEPFISEDARKIIKKELENLKETVSILIFTADEVNKPFNEFSINLFTELSRLSEKIIPKFEHIGGELAGQYNVDRSPTILIQPEKYNIRLTGAPAGEELRTLLLTLIMVSTGMTVLSDASRSRLADLKDKRDVKVFVSPTCPYCPLQAIIAISAAIEKAGLVTTEIIDIYENKDLAAKYNAFSVPQVFIDDRLVGLGLQPEEVFVEKSLPQLGQNQAGGSLCRKEEDRPPYHRCGSCRPDCRDICGKKRTEISSYRKSEYRRTGRDHPGRRELPRIYQNRRQDTHGHDGPAGDSICRHSRR